MLFYVKRSKVNVMGGDGYVDLGTLTFDLSTVLVTQLLQ